MRACVCACLAVRVDVYLLVYAQACLHMCAHECVCVRACVAVCGGVFASASTCLSLCEGPLPRPAREGSGGGVVLPISPHVDIITSLPKSGRRRRIKHRRPGAKTKSRKGLKPPFPNS